MEDEIKFIIDDNKSCDLIGPKQWDKARTSAGKLLEKLVREHIEQIKPSLKPDKQALIDAFIDTKPSDVTRSRFYHMWLLSDELTLFQQCYRERVRALMYKLVDELLEPIKEPLRDELSKAITKDHLFVIGQGAVQRYLDKLSDGIDGDCIQFKLITAEELVEDQADD